VDIAMDNLADFHTKVRTGAYLFRYGWLDLETVTAKLDRYAARTGVDREIARSILSAAFADIQIQSAAS
jgi:hypothetical protein